MNMTEPIAELSLFRESPPFDLIGDVHGCFEELVLLLDRLGYGADSQGIWMHPQGRRAFFVGDLVDRGPGIPAVLKLVMRMIECGHAFCVKGNHDHKLAKRLAGAQGNVGHGMQRSLAQLEAEPEDFRQRVCTFLSGLAHHYVLDGGNLVVAHGGLREDLHGQSSGKARSFALYGDTTGKTDEYGLPVRRDWAADYRGQAVVVYGHTPVETPTWVNNTINIDTGCVFGGSLTALRLPERELISIPALRTYAERPGPRPVPPG
jgi:protein phosphatase